MLATTYVIYDIGRILLKKRNIYLERAVLTAVAPPAQACSAVI